MSCGCQPPREGAERISVQLDISSILLEDGNENLVQLIGDTAKREAEAKVREKIKNANKEA